jgi:hypothetical protein
MTIITLPLANMVALFWRLQRRQFSRRFAPFFVNRWSYPKIRQKTKCTINGVFSLG